MNKLMKCILIIVTLTLMTLLFKVFFPSFWDKDQEGLTEVAPKINVLIMGNTGKNPEQLVEDLEEGNAWLLLWIEKKDGHRQAYTFNTLESLVRLEQNRLGFLDPSDPGFKGLYLAKYNKDEHKLFYTSIQTQDISAIEANRNYLIGEVLSDPKNHKNMAGVVIFSNGNKQQLRMVRIPVTQIEDSKLVPAIFQSNPPKSLKNSSKKVSQSNVVKKGSPSQSTISTNKSLPKKSTEEE